MTRLLLLALLATGAASAQTISLTPSTSGPRTVTVQGQGEAVAPADHARLRFQVVTEGATLDEALRLHEAEVARVQGLLRAAGVPEARITLDRVAVGDDEEDEMSYGGDDAGSEVVRVTRAVTAEVDDLEPEQLDDADAGSLVPAAAVVEQDAPTLAEQRRAAVLAAVRTSGAQRVGDLGCGEGALLPALLEEPAITHVLAADVSARSLEIAARRIGLERMSDTQRSRIDLLQTSLVYTDERLTGLDAVVLMEVIEHVDESRLPALERCVFGSARPATVIVTTPNVEHNVRYETLPAGEHRHRDHRFEWTRDQLREWATEVADRYGYAVELRGIGPVDGTHGAPTQLAVLRRTEVTR